MAVSNFSPSNTDFRINGIAITSWGTGQPPLTIEPIDQSGNLIRGEGGGAVALYRDNFGWRVTVNLLPGSANSAALKALKKARTSLTFSHTVIGTLEVGAGVDGIFVSEGALGRGSSSQVSDDVYTMEFNNADMMRGGTN